MTKIIKLPDEVANRIAAGEVVERPASVVKEAVENSIDANASFIEITIEEGGKKLVQVVDNGDGMEPEDVVLAVERHATSKIKDFEDLSSINTLGFRGEALPSIASVSFFEIVSRPKKNELGFRIIIDHGELIEQGEVGAQLGTTLVVKELFSKIPVRRKFLKSDRSELNACLDWLTKIAIANPHITFRLEHNGNEMFFLNAAENYIQRIVQIFGHEIIEKLLPFDSQNDDYMIFGYAGDRTLNRTNSKEQYIYLNNRPIRSRIISVAIKKAYADFLPSRRHPVLYLFIEAQPELVDINVHPSKLEVRFRREEVIFSVVYKTIIIAVGNKASPAVQPRPLVLTSFENTQQKFDFVMGTTLKTVSLKPQQFEQEILEAISSLGDIDKVRPDSQQSFLQISETYIVVPANDGMYIIDQHAAHERILYERILSAFGGGDILGQRLLFPEEFEISLSWVSFLEDRLELLSSIGFEIEIQPPNKVLIKSIPPFLRSTDYSEIIRGILEDMSEYVTEEPPDIIKRFAASIACHSAIRAGQKLSQEEIEALFDQLFTTDDPYHCPHGRPSLVKFTRHELERIFLRT